MGGEKDLSELFQMFLKVVEKRGGEDMDEYLKIKTTQNRNI